MRNQIISPKRLFLRVTHYSIDDIDERQIQRRVTYFADKIFYRCRQRRIDHLYLIPGNLNLFVLT